MLRTILAVAAGLAAATVWPTRAAAQGAPEGSVWFPATRLFEPLLADPNQPRNTAALLWTDLLESTDAFDPGRPRPPFRLAGTGDGSDLEGAVGIGFEKAVVRLDRWEDGALDVGFTVGVFSRFRLEQPSRDELSNDWYVGIPFTLAQGPLSARFRILHHSSHMGDEAQAQGAQRIEYSWEGVDAVLARSLAPHTRVYGGGTIVLRTNSYVLVPSVEGDYVPVVFTESAALQAGGETGWFPWADGRAGLVAGLDWQAADRSGWHRQLSLVAGVEADGAAFGTRLLARCFDGPSNVGEFFLGRERYCALEFGLRF